MAPFSSFFIGHVVGSVDLNAKMRAADYAMMEWPEILGHRPVFRL